MGDVNDVDPELNRYRVVEALVLRKTLTGLFGCLFAENGPTGVARNEPRKGERDDEDTEQDQIDVLTITYPVSDDEALWERLTANPLTEVMPIDLQALADEDQPPPRAAFWLLDRLVPETGVDISRSDVPTIRGEMFLFG